MVKVPHPHNGHHRAENTHAKSHEPKSTPRAHETHGHAPASTHDKSAHEKHASHDKSVAHDKPAVSEKTFAQLDLAKPLLEALKEEKYTTPTPIQAKAIPPIIEGRDVLGCAQTGTGKTAAFALPLLHRLATMPVDTTRRGPALPRVLVLSPTRELATQIGDSFATYGRHTGFTHTVIFGGVSQFHQVRALHRGVDILVATPGRLIDLMEQRLMNFSRVGVLVLDEADRMLDMGFIQPIRRIVAAFPTPRQTLMFSATMPKEIVKLADSLLHDPVKVSVAPVASTIPKIEQSVYMVPKAHKQALLEHLVELEGVTRAVVFTKTKHGADRVKRRLDQAGITSQAIHGNKAQNYRTRALDAFKSGRAKILVATDVAARGLDVDGISHVFNFDLPMEPEAYVHRIGRTGRAGATGVAISFCDHEERGLLRDIERLTGAKVRAITELPDLPEPRPQLDRPMRSFDGPSRPERRPYGGGPGHSRGSGPAPRHAQDQRTDERPRSNGGHPGPSRPSRDNSDRPAFGPPGSGGGRGPMPQRRGGFGGDRSGRGHRGSRP